MTDVRKATDGRTRLRPGWEDQNARFSAEDIKAHALTPTLRRDAYPHTLHVHGPTHDGTWEWTVVYRTGGFPEPTVARGYSARTAGEAMRKADAAHARLVASYARPRKGRG